MTESLEWLNVYQEQEPAARVRLMDGVFHSTHEAYYSITIWQWHVPVCALLKGCQQTGVANAGDTTNLWWGG